MYDKKCWQLANEFLDDHKAIQTVANVDKLAQEIQDRIEDWISGAESDQSRDEAMAEYGAHRAARKLTQEQYECPHDEHDHGICLDCGLDITDDLIAKAEFNAECREDR